MTPQDAQSVHRADRLLKRIDVYVKCAGVFLIIPAAMAVYAHLPFAGWVVAALVIALAFELMMTIVIAVGQRCGLVGRTLFKATSTADLDDPLDTAKREPPPVVRKADDTLLPRDCPVVSGGRIHVAHVPGRGDVRYRIG